MREHLIEKFLSRILAYGVAFTTIFIISGSVTDPVNTPKMFTIGLIGCTALAVLLGSSLFKRIRGEKIVLAAPVLFFIFMLNSTFASSAPITQILYGSYGRNNGLLTYLFLSLILTAALALRSQQSFTMIVRAMLIAGAINIVYCLWVLLFGDFIGWSNPYGNILGTLGNPNFIGAFLGIIFSSCLVIVLDKGSKSFLRVLAALSLPVITYEIIKSHAIQGRVVAAFGTALVLFLFIRSRFNKFVLVCYSTLSLSVGGLALAGALQKGPLAQYIYKTSVSLRGQYWLAGWNTGQSHPLTGVGMDAFGDWYRRMRDIHAIELPGVNVVVNAAHNVPIDIFAFGGWPLFISYLLIMSLAGFAIFRIATRQKIFDPTFAVMATAWAGYQLQSIISINQIGLAVWGWLLSGALIAYERATRDVGQNENDQNQTLTRIKSKIEPALPAQIPLHAALGALIGLILALPPFTADLKWRSAQVSRMLPALEASMIPSYFNPQNSTEYLMNIQSLESSSLFDLSHRYALDAVKWNPECFELWKVLYLVKNSTPEEKELALEKMKQLDPLNPDVTAR